MDCSMPGFPVLHYLPEFAQTHVHWVTPSNHLILSSPSPPVLNLSQHQGLFPAIFKNQLFPGLISLSPMNPFNFNIKSKHSLAGVHSSLLHVLTSRICRDVFIMQSRIQCPLNSLPLVLYLYSETSLRPPTRASPLLDPWLLLLLRGPPISLWMPQAPWAPLPDWWAPNGRDPSGQPDASPLSSSCTPPLRRGDKPLSPIISEPAGLMTAHILMNALKTGGMEEVAGWVCSRNVGCDAKKGLRGGLSSGGTVSDWGALGVCPFGSRKEIQMSKGGETNTRL